MCQLHSIFRFFCLVKVTKNEKINLFAYFLYKKSTFCLEITADFFSFFGHFDQKRKMEWTRQGIEIFGLDGFGSTPFCLIRGHSKTTWTKLCPPFWLPSVHVDIFYPEGEKLSFFEHLPTSSFPRSFWTTPTQVHTIYSRQSNIIAVRTSI